MTKDVYLIFTYNKVDYIIGLYTDLTEGELLPLVIKWRSKIIKEYFLNRNEFKIESVEKYFFDDNCNKDDFKTFEDFKNGTDKQGKYMQLLKLFLERNKS